MSRRREKGVASDQPGYLTEFSTLSLDTWEVRGQTNVRSVRASRDPHEPCRHVPEMRWRGFLTPSRWATSVRLGHVCGYPSIAASPGRCTSLIQVCITSRFRPCPWQCLWLAFAVDPGN